MKDVIEALEARFWKQMRLMRIIHETEYVEGSQALAASGLVPMFKADVDKLFKALRNEPKEIRDVVHATMQAEQDRLDEAFRVVEAEGYPDGWIERVWPINA